MTTVRKLMDEMDEINGEYANSIMTASVDFLDDLKSISEKYDEDFEITVRCTIESLIQTLYAFGIDETFNSFKLACAAKDKQ